MSRRQLKKISGYDETAELMKAMGVDKEDLKESKPQKSRAKPKKAGFASFAAFEDEEDEIEEPEEPEEPEEEKEAIVTPTSKSKKKKRKKKKKEDDFDQILDQYGFKGDDKGATEDKSENFSLAASVLQIESKYLDPDAELKRIFGAAALSATRDSPNRNRNHRNQRLTHRGTIINRSVVGNLPPVRGGLGMVEDERKENTEKAQWWRFTHNKEYQERETQSAFEASMKASSHEMVMAVLQRSPFHCDSLVSLSDACRLQDDTTASKELLERLLYAMESSLHPRCVIGNGRNRLDYRRPENRALFGGLFRYCQLSAKRGCWRTALEQAKLLLSFDPSDPLAVVLLIPLFALRSGKFEILIEMENELSYRDVSSLPNWSLAIALCFIHLEKPDEAQERLQSCLRKHPGLLFPLLEKMQAEPCATLVSSGHFNTKEPAAKQLLYKLICSREVDLWKDGRAQVALQTAAEAVVSETSGVNPSMSNSTKIPPQVVRHALLCDFPITNLKPEDSLSHDPLPPSDTIREYTPKIPESSNPLLNANFLTSMVPGLENQNVENVQQQVRTLVNSMASLLDQMRTVQDVPDVPDEAEQEISEPEFD